MSTVDVAVVGSGIFGLSIAYSCIIRGASVRVIDAKPHSHSASYGIVGALAPHSPDEWTPKKQFQLESLSLAGAWWARVANSSGIDPGYARVGRLQPVASERSLELARIRALAALENWAGIAEWRLLKVAQTDDWRPASATGWFVSDNLTARINPRKAVDSLYRAIVEYGGEFIVGQCRPGPAKNIVWATGHRGLEKLSAELGTFIGAPEKGQALLIDLDARSKPLVSGSGVLVVPHADGTTAIGSTSERYFESLYSTDQRLDSLLANATQLLPSVQNVRVLCRWAHARPRSVTRAPILGAHPKRENHFIANGGFKIGFGFAPMIGETMADLVLEERDEIPQDFKLSHVLETARMS